jgi:hypothetical protein
MADRVLVVTYPDDSLEDGVRLLLVDLTSEQLHAISEILARVETPGLVVAYIWKTGISTDWILDKKHKTDYIFFNADSSDQTLVGYLAAQRNSSYFGTLRSINRVNKSAILDTDQCATIIENIIDKHEQTPK